MERLILVASAALIGGILSLCVLSAMPITLGQDAPSNQTLPDIEEIYHTCLNEPLQEAGETITDPDTKRYYDKLLSDCELGTTEPPQQGED
jgi:hypothetical protein